jgi:ubiquinone/menaquinone biosynthesis C-methylase UbiE/uncharacterized protein YbaR (Trm112 family)
MHGSSGALPPALLEALACPACRIAPEVGATELHCSACGRDYPVRGRVVDLRLPEATSKAEHGDWIEHWSNGNQELFSQRFFSLYRKTVFARTVAYFIQRYFPARGLFVEAGSGTSETSCRIDKRAGERVLVATDIVAEVLQACDPAMDARVAADAFRLPFLDHSIDGIWNVGVMEHFPHELIDAMLREFHRVLKPGAPVLLLWPATDSLPQKGLRLVEAVINARRKGDRFRFHPDEISKLRSSEEGRAVMRRNGFEPVTVDAGLRSLMAFKTVVGRKPRTAAGVKPPMASTEVNR